MLWHLLPLDQHYTMLSIQHIHRLLFSMLAGTYASCVQCAFSVGCRFTLILHPLLFMKQNVSVIWFSLRIHALLLVSTDKIVICNLGIILLFLLLSYFNHLNKSNK